MSQKFGFKFPSFFKQYPIAPCVEWHIALLPRTTLFSVVSSALWRFFRRRSATSLARFSPSPQMLDNTLLVYEISIKGQFAITIVSKKAGQ